MSNNNYREFLGKPLLEKEPMIQIGELKNPMTSETLCDSWTAVYNRHTDAFNRATTRGEQEFYLDQRFRFIMSCVETQKQNNAA